MTPQKKTVLFSEAPLHIEGAVRRLSDSPQEELAFVVVNRGEEAHLPGPFVQFCGSAEEGVMFDAPQLGIVAGPETVMPSVLEAAKTAVNGLIELGVVSTDLVTITEDNSLPPTRRFKRWLKKKLSEFGWEPDTQGA